MREGGRETMLDKGMNILQKTTEIFVALLLMVMTCLVFTNVLTRYVFHFAIAWSEEISRFLMVWIVFVGAALAYKEDAHMGLDIVVKALPKKTAQVIAVIVDLAVIYCLYLMLTGGYELTASMIRWKAPASGLAYSWKFASVVISGVMMELYAVTKLYHHVKELIGKGEVSC